MTTGPFTEELRRQLLDSATRLDRRRTRLHRSLAVLAVAVIAATIVTLDGARPQPAAAGVQVTEAGGVVTLRLKGPHVTATDVDRAARRVGLDASTRAVPVGPSLTGRLIRTSSDRPLPTSFALLGPDGAFTGFRLPASWSGRLALDIGRTAKPDETYVRASDAFAPGEPLECRQLIGHDLRAVLAALSDKGLHVSVAEATTRRALDQPTGLVLGDAEVTAPGRVLLLGVAQGDPPVRTPPPAC